MNHDENERLIGAQDDKEISIGIARSSSALIFPSSTGTASATASIASTSTKTGLSSSELSNSPVIEIGAAAQEEIDQPEPVPPAESAIGKRAWRILDRETCWHEREGERLIRSEGWIEIWDIGPTRLVAAFWQPAAVIEK